MSAGTWCSLYIRRGRNRWNEGTFRKEVRFFTEALYGWSTSHLADRSLFFRREIGTPATVDFAGALLRDPINVTAAAASENVVIRLLAEPRQHGQ